MKSELRDIYSLKKTDELAEDAENSSGTIIAKKGTNTTSRVISILKRNNISSVRVVLEPDPANPEEAVPTVPLSEDEQRVIDQYKPHEDDRIMMKIRDAILFHFQNNKTEE